MKKIATFLTVAFALMASFAYAQPYELEVFEDVYNDLSSSSTITVAPWDDFDNEVLEFSMGYDFLFFGTIVDDLSIGTLGIEAIESLNTLDDTYSVILPCHGDLISRGSGGVSTTKLSFEVEGAVGSRIFKQEWKNVGFFEDDAGASFINFQFWFHEEDGAVEFRYGPSLLTAPAFELYEEGGPLVGLMNKYDNSSEEFETALFLSGNPNSPELHVVSEAGNIPLILSGQPADGIVYRFTRNNINAVERTQKTVALQVFPTLIADVLNLKFEGSLTEKEYQITDLAGSTIVSQQVLERKTINLSFLKSGMYFVNLYEEGSLVSVAKFIKM